MVSENPVSVKEMTNMRYVQQAMGWDSKNALYDQKYEIMTRLVDDARKKIRLYSIVTSEEFGEKKRDRH